MLSMAKNILEDSLLPGACVSTGANRTAFVLHEYSFYLMTLLPRKRDSSVS